MGSSAHQLWVEERRNILLEVMSSAPEKEWTSRELALAMKEHPIIQRKQPTYSKSTAALDMESIRGDIFEQRQDIAAIVLRQQLTTTEQMRLDTLDLWEKELESYRALAESDFMAVDGEGNAYVDEKAKEAAYSAQINRLEKLHRMLDRTMTRQGKILPIEVAKKLDVSTPTTLNINAFLNLREKAGLTVTRPELLERTPQQLALEEGDVVEGEYVE